MMLRGWLSVLEPYSYAKDAAKIVVTLLTSQPTTVVRAPWKFAAWTKYYPSFSATILIKTLSLFFAEFFAKHPSHSTVSFAFVFESSQPAWIFPLFSRSTFLFCSILASIVSTHKALFAPFILEVPTRGFYVACFVVNFKMNLRWWNFHSANLLK